MAEFNLIQVNKNDNIAYITMNRPPANALDSSLVQEMKTAIDRLEKENEIKVVVINSDNEKVFCAGADISLLENLNTASMSDFGNSIKNLIMSMYSSKNIYIASIEGHCLGGGLELALGCDFRIAKEGNARIGLPEINLGLFPGGGGIQLVGRLVGQQKAFILSAMGESLTISEAHQWGLIDFIYPKDEYPKKLLQIAQQIAHGPSTALHKIKQSIYFALPLEIRDAFDLESNMINDLLDTEDFHEGLLAFKEKRTPQFKGR
jgi:enoyl-CoA hydratase/carnithine racemase